MDFVGGGGYRRGMPTNPTNSPKKPARGRAAGPALREARREAEAARARIAELEAQMKLGGNAPPRAPDEPATNTTSSAAAPEKPPADFVADPLHEEIPPPPKPTKADEKEGESSKPENQAADVNDETDESGDESASSSGDSSGIGIGADAAEGLLRALLGQMGHVNRFIAVKLLHRQATAKAVEHGVAKEEAEELAKAFVVGIAGPINRIATFSPKEVDAIVRVALPKVIEMTKDLEGDDLLWLTIGGIYVGKFTQLVELTELGADFSNAASTEEHETVDVTPKKDAAA